MISFVWTSNYPFLAGTGGSENYTAGHIRELLSRGIDTRLITIGFGENDGREDFPDIPFTALQSKDELSGLDDTIVYVTNPVAVTTKKQSYVILHCPLSLCDSDEQFFSYGIDDKHLIAPSQYAANVWANHFGRPISQVPVVYPFAEPAFAKVQSAKRTNNKTRVLFAGRLTPDKGVYTLMATLHLKILQEANIEVTATTACDHSEEGKIIKKLFQAHPQINLIPARKTPQSMAKLFAEHDIVVMPSTSQFWHEAFGIVSVEAQHAGCRVVASNGGGLPETDCGGLILVEPDNPLALAKGIVHAAKLGRLTEQDRAAAIKKFTVGESIDSLFKVIGYPQQSTTAIPLKPAAK